jgi:hypothetical protein
MEINIQRTTGITQGYCKRLWKSIPRRLQQV